MKKRIIYKMFPKKITASTPIALELTAKQWSWILSVIISGFFTLALWYVNDQFDKKIALVIANQKLTDQELTLKQESLKKTQDWMVESLREIRRRERSR